MKNDNRPLDAKIITLGDSKVGKSSLIIKFIDNKFSSNYLSTVGFDLKHKSIKLQNGEDIKLVIHDTAGEERFKSLSTNYIKKANGVLLVYDITLKESFINITNWMNDIVEEAGNKVPIVLVGNKSDLKKERIVSKEEGKKMAKQYNLQFFETSAKDGTNVEKCFLEIAQQIIEKKSQRKMSISNNKLLKKQKNDKNKKKKDPSKFLSFDLNTIIKFLSFVIPFLLFFSFNTMRMMKKDNKKEMDESTKELLELIKERGRNSPNYKENNNNDKNKQKDEKDKEKTNEKEKIE